MKTRLAVVLIVAIGFLAAAFVLTRSICSRCASGESPRVRSFAALSKAIDLEPAQMAKAETLYREYEGRINECCVSHCAARAELADEMLKAKPDPDKVRERIEQMTRAQMDSDMATAAFISRLREAITPAQSEKLGRLVKEMLSGACPMGRAGALSLTGDKP